MINLGTRQEIQIMHATSSIDTVQVEKDDLRCNPAKNVTKGLQ